MIYCFMQAIGIADAENTYGDRYIVQLVLMKVTPLDKAVNTLENVEYLYYSTITIVSFNESNITLYCLTFEENMK